MPIFFVKIAQGRVEIYTKNSKVNVDDFDLLYTLKFTHTYSFIK